MLGKNYAVSLSDMGEVTQAGQLFVEVVQGRMAKLGPEHPDTLAAQLNLANMLAGRGNTAGARTLMETVVRGYASVLGPRHCRTLRALNR